MVHPTDCEPLDYHEATTGANKEEWKMAIKSELDAHHENETWTEIDRPRTGTTFTAKWVFTKKRKWRHGKI